MTQYLGGFFSIKEVTESIGFRNNLANQFLKSGGL